MKGSRRWCAIALMGIGACSFPDYQVAPSVAGPSCSNDVRDGDETGVDCGPSCEPCAVCSDGMRNGDETGVDCGGSCGACPRCDDGQQNGTESDIDCGGTCATRCDTDRRCRENADCASLVCNGVCQPSSCLDEVRNGQETGVDCGGSCAGCANGSACVVNDDCQSARCQQDVCVDALCTDGVVNGHETDVDCGGDQCAPCVAPDKCKVPDDCESLICKASKCVAPSCSDLVQNQDESAVDCGGSACAACGVGSSCARPQDCASGLCQRNICVPENPSGQTLSRSTWTLTSSESGTESGNANALDGDDTTVWTSGTRQHVGAYVDVDLGKQAIFFKALLKVVDGAHPADFPGYIDAYVSSDGSFGEPTKPHVQGNQWLWVDFEGAQVGRYLRFEITQANGQNWSIGELYVYD